MDSFTTQISSLRTALLAALAQVDGLAASATAIPTAIPVATPLVFPEVPTHPPGTAVGAGLPPTEGGRSIEWYEAELAALSLPIPPRIQAQQTLGVATPATFGSVEANAAHYLLGKALYEPSQALLEAEDAAYKAWREAMVASNSAPYGKVGAARAAERAAHWALKDASNAVLNAKQLVERFQDYNDGTFASRSCYRGGGTYFIYRFYVFEALDGYYTSAATWKPIGLLNPHAYNAYKASRARGKTFVDFVDASQPAPDVVAYWRAIFDMEKDDESLPPCEDDDEDALCEGDGWRLRLKEQPPAVHPYPNGLRLKEQPLVQVAVGGGGGGPSEAVYLPALPPTLSRQNAVADLSTPAGEAVPPVHPYPNGLPYSGAGSLAATAVATIPPKTGAGGGITYEDLVNLMNQQKHNPRLRELYEGTWTTLPDGRRAMVYRFYAYQPPANGSYLTAQALTCLGLYDPGSRSLDSTKNATRPPLPSKQADWPWA